ncbi:MAG TPA: hypothetical protein VGI79_14975 [Caulobacteraceae bacterium]
MADDPIDGVVSFLYDFNVHWLSRRTRVQFGVSGFPVPAQQIVGDGDQALGSPHRIDDLFSGWIWGSRSGLCWRRRSPSAHSEKPHFPRIIHPLAGMWLQDLGVVKRPNAPHWTFSA